MKKYEAYKESGIEWMNEIPNHWALTRMRYLCAIETGDKDTENREENGAYPFFVRSQTVERISSYTFDGEAILTAGDGVGVCKVWHYVNGKFDCHQRVYRLSNFRGVNGRFLFYYIRENFVKEVMKLSAKSTVDSLRMPMFQDFKISFGSLEEQTTIANYLDDKTSQLDTLITKKEKLIELLQEERAAIINHAVTKGLDSNVPMKDSGIEWLGEIPAHWEMKKVKHINTKIGSGVTPKGGAEVYQEAGIPLLRSQNVYFDGFRLDDVAYISEEIHNSMSGSKVYRSDVLLNITGGSIGRCYYVTNEFDEANVNQHVCIIRPNANIETVYLYNLLRSDVGQLQIDLCQTGGNREALNFEQLKNFIIPLPSTEEQKEILENVNKREGEINTIIAKTHQEIELLKEYKTALISEVVTGKVDVRNEIFSV